MFALGTRYSQDMNATYLDAQGQSKLIEMGCYGIGITRVVAAAIEQNHDAKGHHLARAAGAVRRGAGADRLRPQRRASGRSPTGFTTSSRRPGSRCCSTTAASGLA